MTDWPRFSGLRTDPEVWTEIGPLLKARADHRNHRVVFQPADPTMTWYLFDNEVEALRDVLNEYLSGR